MSGLLWAFSCLWYDSKACYSVKSRELELPKKPMTNEEIAKLVNARRVHQIRAGDKHRFIDISIVETGGRFFVRQYKFGKKSWYHAFLQDPHGAMKCGDTVIPIDGKVPEDLDEINPKLTRAFWKKYHLIYAAMRLGFDTKQHEASTLEFIPKG